MNRYPTWLVLVLALLSGCATSANHPPPGPVADVDRAAALVWAHYAAPGHVPKVVLVAPNCTKSGDRVGIRDPWGRCVGGWTLSDGVVYTIWQEGGTFSRDTALAHELRHAALMRWSSPVPHHIEVVPVEAACAVSARLCERHRFFYETVEAANEQLRKAGL